MVETSITPSVIRWVLTCLFVTVVDVDYNIAVYLKEESERKTAQRNHTATAKMGHIFEANNN